MPNKNVSDLFDQLLGSHFGRGEYFEQYKLGDPLLEHGEQMKLAGIELTEEEALEDEHDVTELYDAMIEFRMAEEDNNLILWFDGMKRFGKSTGAQRSAIKLRNAYLRARGIKPTPSKEVEGIRNAFNNDQMSEELPKMERGDVFIRDEGEIMEGGEKINQANEITNMNTISGAAQYSWIYCDPKASINLKIYDYKLRPYGKDKTAKKTRFFIWDFYGFLLGHVFLEIPGPEYKRFVADYLKKKKGNIEEMRDAGGRASANVFSTTNLKHVRRLVEKIAEWEAAHGKISTDEAEVLLDRLKVPGSLRAKHKMVVAAMMDYEESKQTRQTAVAAPVVHAGTNYPDFFLHNAAGLSEDAKEAIALYLRGFSERDAQRELNVTRDAVRKYKREGRRHAIGIYFEWYCAFLIGVPLDQIPHFCAGNDRVPDLVWKGEIYSFKWRDNTDPSQFFSFTKKKELLQEAQEALKQGKQFHFLYTNLGWKIGRFKILHIVADPHDPAGGIEVNEGMLARQDLLFGHTVPPEAGVGSI